MKDQRLIDEVIAELETYFLEMATQSRLFDERRCDTASPTLNEETFVLVVDGKEHTLTLHDDKLASAAQNSALLQEIKAEIKDWVAEVGSLCTHIDEKGVGEFREAIRVAKRGNLWQCAGELLDDGKRCPIPVSKSGVPFCEQHGGPKTTTH